MEMTLEIVKANSIETLVPNEVVSNWEHVRRLQKLTGLDYGCSSYYYGVVDWRWCGMLSAGFSWVVPRDIVYQFKYAAGLGIGSGVIYGEKDPTCQVGSWKTKQDIIYAGDIPDFILDNIDKARKYDFACLSIHSNEPLPAQLRKSDPVMLGWYMPACLQVDKNGKLLKCFNERANEIAFVIGIWGEDGLDCLNKII